MLPVMTQYHFVTHWHVDAPIDDVWETISHSERWPSWWKGVEKVVELEAGNKDGIGNLRHYVWKSLLPYRLGFDVRTTRIERPHVLAGDASGELAGTGRWDIRESPAGGTDLTYYWDVRTTRAWMNALAPLARPIFRWNHNYVMNSGARGLAKLLEGRTRGAVADSPPG
jgi:Polyketide cyclase / dehydrase and lipid transport